MPGNSTVVFRGALNGYNKNDVIDYIAQMTKTHAKVKADYEKKIEILENRLEKASAENAELSAKLAEAEAKSARLLERLNEAEELIKAMQEAQNDASAGISSVEQGKVLPGSPDEVQSDVDINEKLRLYDEISGRIGEIILRANAVADDIVNEARNRSRALLEKTADDISETCKMLISILDDAKNQLRNKSILDIKSDADTKESSQKDDILRSLNNIADDDKDGGSV
ncbi:MAG TPA: hypothetical protein PLZ27_00660 [Bacillota bacterium]|mgnify:FL=1|nr:hypothetical protein [Bacillota bacterium]